MQVKMISIVIEVNSKKIVNYSPTLKHLPKTFEDGPSMEWKGQIAKKLASVGTHEKIELKQDLSTES